MDELVSKFDAIENYQLKSLGQVQSLPIRNIRFKLLAKIVNFSDSNRPNFYTMKLTKFTISSVI